MPSTVFQVFGANTDVGKTVVSAGLLRAAVAGPPRRQATYVKPLQTGDVHDGTFVQRYAPKEVHCHTLYSWSTPISPHLAAAKEGKTVTGEDLLAKLQAHLQQGQGEEEAEQGGKESQVRGITLVETAGGVLSPGPSSALQTQADLYRPVRLPVLLVGDGRLGGISTTLAAYESLYSRGYDVHAIAILDSPDHLDNAAAVRTYINVTLGHPSLPVVSLPALPPLPPSSSSISTTPTETINGDEDSLTAWYKKHEELFRQLLAVLVGREQARVQRLRAMPDLAAEVFWYPFTQHRDLNSKHLHVVDSAYGDHYSIIEKRKDRGEEEGREEVCSSRRLIDACASWWTQGLGHGRADVALAVGAAAGRYGHVIFPGNVHEPALRVAELMLAGPGKGWANRVFFSDNGSTAMEIAVKMALKKASNILSSSASEEEEGDVQVAVVTQRDCYHGDTLGCMDAAAPTVFNTGQHPWYQPRTLSLAVPTIGYVQGQLQVEVPPEIVAASSLSSSSSSSSSSSVGARVLPFPGGMATLLDLPAREKSEAADIYRRAIQAQMDAFEAEGEEQGGRGQPQRRRRRLGAVLLEPVLMGAAGMILVDPLFQRLLTLEGRARGLPVVFDEVASGLHRLGCASAAELLGVTPDIACYGKTLTGGYLPLALTLTTEVIFEAFHGPAKSDALLHGHSYTANPLACAAAVRALEAYEAMHKDRDQQQHSSSSGSSSSHRCVYNEGQVATLSQIAGVRRAVALGTVLAVELAEREGGQGGGYGSTASAHVVQDLKHAGVYARPLGNVVYLLASQVASERTTQILVDTLEQVLRHRATIVGSENGLEGNGGVVI